jgi:predicted dehydrogenase
MVKKLKVGIVSAAWGTHAHLPAWRTLDDVDVVAICTSRQETAEIAAKAHGVERAYWNVDEMAASDLDIIDVGTRPVWRQKMVLSALAGGKNVYAGIAFATDAAHAHAMYEAQASSGLVGVVDAYIQAIPAVSLLKEKLDQGLLGEIHSVRCRFDLSLFSPKWIGVPTYSWFADAENGASAMRNLGSHCLHALVYLFGEVEQVTGMADIRLKSWPAADGSVITPETDDTAMALLRFSSGVMGHLYVGWAAVAGQGFELEVQGSEGRMTVSAPPYFPEAFTTTTTHAPLGQPGDATVRTLEIPSRLKTVDRSVADADEQRGAIFPMARLFRGMVDAIRGGGEAQPSFRQAAHVQQVISAVLASSAGGGWKSVPAL